MRNHGTDGVSTESCPKNTPFLLGIAQFTPLPPSARKDTINCPEKLMKISHFGVVKRLLLGIKRQLWKNMTRNTHLNYKTLLGVTRSSVQFEVSPSQEGLPKQIAQDVGSSLLCPPPLKQESIIPPLGSFCSTRCDHFKSPKEHLSLTSYCTL